MIRICAWCKANLDPKQKDQEGPITHGICDSCLEMMLAGPKTMNDFLDSLDLPVLMVGSNAEVVFANRVACEVTGNTSAELKGKLGGDALQCIHARNPQGCGKHVHCKSCAVRNSVNHTYATGEPCVRVPAHMDVINTDVTTEIRFLVSTEKAGETVLLQIEDIAAVE
ncbi:MAG: hypothetical protein HN909_03480 [Phycisphaerales bacterium]|jgi:hypothetical protein|nr:hypothetical protein [Phycisphaerales bacterium]MBT7170814.1 hypothetical protein [Phycisphaerales bacterium]